MPDSAIRTQQATARWAIGMPSWHSRSQSRSSLDPARGTTGERQSGPGLPVYHVSACKPADRADAREMDEFLSERAPQPPVAPSSRVPAASKLEEENQATVKSSAADTSATAAAAQSYSTGTTAATSPHVSKGDPLTDFVRVTGAAVNNVVQAVSDALCVPSSRFLRRKWAKQARTRRTRRVMALIARRP